MDLVAFPPVCLPSPGQSFEGSDGIIAGENITRSSITQPTYTWEWIRNSDVKTMIPSILSNWVPGRLGID